MSTDYQMKKSNKLESIYMVGDAKCEKGISDNLSRTPQTNKARTVSTLKGL